MGYRPLPSQAIQQPQPLSKYRHIEEGHSPTTMPRKRDMTCHRVGRHCEPAHASTIEFIFHRATASFLDYVAEFYEPGNATHSASTFSVSHTDELVLS